LSYSASASQNEQTMNKRARADDPSGTDDGVEMPGAIIDGIEQSRRLVGEIRREGRTMPALRLDPAISDAPFR
jgi:hypothetical protein